MTEEMKNEHSDQASKPKLGLRKEDSETLAKPKLSLRDGGLSGKACPMCKAPMGEKDSICISCGFDTIKNKYIKTKTSNSRKREKTKNHPILSVFFLLITGISVFCWLKPEEAKEIYSSRILPFYEEKIQPAYEEYVQPQIDKYLPELNEKMKTMMPGAVNESSDIVSVTPNQPVVQQTPGPETAVADSGNDPEAILRRHIERQYPPFEIGEKAVFKALNGKEATGIFEGIENGNIRVRIADGRIASTPLNALDQETRIRCSAEEREKYIAGQLAR